MVGSVEPDHLKGKGLRPIIDWILEGDRKIDLPKWHDLLSRHDAVVRHPGRPDARSVKAHGIERFSVHDVEAAASIHQHLGESLRANDRVDHERISPWLWMLSEWSFRSKVMADSDHRRKIGTAGSAI